MNSEQTSTIAANQTPRSGNGIRWKLAIILLFALTVRTAGAAWWHNRVEQSGEDPQFQFGDSGTYWYLARQIANGESFQYGSPYVRVFRTPGYPAILAPLFMLSEHPSPFLASMMNVVFGTITVWLVFVLARMIFDDWVGLTAAGLCAIYAGAIGMSIFVLSEGPFCMLAMLHLICWIAAMRSETFKGSATYALLAGVICGAAILVRPSWLLFVPFAGLLLFAFSPGRSRTATQVVTMIVGMALVMSPWWIRNYHVTGHFVPTTLQTGSSLYDGLNPSADGTSEMSFVIGERTKFIAGRLQQVPDSQSSIASGFDPAKPNRELFNFLNAQFPDSNFEYDFDSHLKSESVGWATSHPTEVVSLSLKKFMIMWSPMPTGNGISSRVMSWLICVSYVPLILLAVCGAFRFWKRGPEVWLCAMPAIYFTLLHMIFVASIRYRQPAMLALLVLAAAFIVNFSRRWRDVS